MKGCCGCVKRWQLIDVSCYECQSKIKLAELEKFYDIRLFWVISLSIVAVLLVAGIVIIELLVNRPDLLDWARPAPAAGDGG